jgi:hypothetical protein
MSKKKKKKKLKKRKLARLHQLQALKQKGGGELATEGKKATEGKAVKEAVVEEKKQETKSKEINVFKTDLKRLFIMMFICLFILVGFVVVIYQTNFFPSIDFLFKG